jgi:hypothetical protein
VEHGRGAGAAALEAQAIALTMFEVNKRPRLPQVKAATVYFRDNFRCRYCGWRTIARCATALSLLPAGLTGKGAGGSLAAKGFRRPTGSPVPAQGTDPLRIKVDHAPCVTRP